MHKSAHVLAAVVFTAAFTFGGCGSDEATSESGGGAQACVPGESKACVGEQGCSGFQVCASDGASFSACDCGTGSGGSSAGGAGGDGGTTAGNGGTTAGNGGSTAGNGGSTAGNGGSTAGNGGSTAGTGGSTAGNGGSTAGTGGSTAGNGGSSAGTGGTGTAGGASVECGTTTCDAAGGEQCCLSLFGGFGGSGFGGFGGSGFGGNSGSGGGGSSCVAAGEQCGGFGSVPVTCDGPSDCGNGQVCCGNLSQGGPGGGAYTDIGCTDASNCSDPQTNRQICDPQASDPCPNNGSCDPSQILPQGWFICN